MRSVSLCICACIGTHMMYVCIYRYIYICMCIYRKPRQSEPHYPAHRGMDGTVRRTVRTLIIYGDRHSAHSPSALLWPLALKKSHLLRNPTTRARKVVIPSQNTTISCSGSNQYADSSHICSPVLEQQSTTLLRSFSLAVPTRDLQLQCALWAPATSPPESPLEGHDF
jgi:hypothetical protein